MQWGDDVVTSDGQMFADLRSAHWAQAAQACVGRGADRGEKAMSLRFKKFNKNNQLIIDAGAGLKL
jgi:hypothetical protein